MAGSITCTPLPDLGGFRIFVDWSVGTINPDADLLVERLVDGQPDVAVRPAYAPTQTATTGGGLAYLYRDAYNRVVANAWGTPNIGPAWTVIGTATNYSVDGTRGVHTAPAANTILTSNLPISLADVDVTVDFQSSIAPTGATTEGGIRARWIDDSNFVDVRVFLSTSGTVTISIRQVAAGVETGSGFLTVAGVTTTTNIRIRLRAVGPTLMAKAWDAATTEPAAWNVVLFGITHLAAGPIRLRTDVPSGVTNPMPAAFRWDNFKAGTGLNAPEQTQLLHITNCGQLFLWDFEAPMDTSVQYRVTDPVTGETVTSAACVVSSGGAPWLKDPINPCRNIRMGDCESACPPRDTIIWIGHENEGYRGVSAQFDVIGRRRPISISQIRKDAVTVLQFGTITCAARDTLLALTAPGTVLYLPEYTPICWPDRYLALGDHTVIPLSRDLRRTERLHTLPAVVVDAPAGSTCCVTGTSWCEMCACAETWDDMDALNLTGIQVLQGEAVEC